MVGFIEAEGSFYLASKDSTRIVHGFGLTQKLDRIVLEGIKLILHIPTSIRYKSNHNHYILDTTNSRAIENIIEYFHNTMKGMKSLELKLWSKAFYYRNTNIKKVAKIHKILLKLRCKYSSVSDLSSKKTENIDPKNYWS